MSFRILFADDSMTAQNMGKKILTDAGYEVVAVSNGAAAVKKIAEQKPDIIILDIYMPGYSGLEVCDKVRASVETLKTPVLLTVGKMEPYKAEDANRVRADGVIIKPFEASDLLAVIKKLEERVVPKTIALAQDTVLLERPPEFEEFEPPLAKDAAVNGGRSASNIQATVEVPDNMATTAAFSDMLGTETAYSLDPLPVPRSAPVAEPETFSEPPAGAVDQAWPPAPSVSHQVEREVSPEPQVELTATPAPIAEPESKESENGGSEVPAVAVTGPSEEIAGAVETKVEAEVPEVIHEELEVTAAQPEPEQEGHRFIDPELAIDVVSFDQTPVPVQTETATSEPQGAVAEVSPAEVEKTPPPEEAVKHTDSRVPAAASEDDFEARVAAAMSIYDAQGEESVEAAKDGVSESAPAVVEEVTPSFEYTPPVNAPTPAEVEASSMLVTTEATMVIPVYLEPAAEPKHEEPAATPEVQSAPPEETVQVVEQQVESQPEVPTLVTREATMVIPVYLEPAAEPKQEEPAPAPQAQSVPEEAVQAVEQHVESQIEAAIPEVTAAAVAAAPAEVGADTMMITAAVDRILERLKPQMIEEISRELKTKKSK